MPEDRKRPYQSVTSLPSLRPHIGVPPLKMVLVGDLNDNQAETASGEGPESTLDSGPDAQAAKEQVVRKIIEHLKKDI